tara:strand:+ start:224 stop:667 length:444 start_codon:yes stop_codon:yes gene_type:complete
MNTEYKEGDHAEFIIFLFSSDPKPRNTIVLESPPLNPSKNKGLHIFEQLLMIFVDGLKYFHANEEGKVDVNTLSLDHMAQMNLYFQSMGYETKVDIFETIHEYQFRYPNYFKDQDKITSETRLSDFYYEIYGQNNRVFRVSFQRLVG